VKAGRTPTVLSEIQKKEDSLFKSFAEMEKVISALANQDAIKIFYAAGEGIKSSTEAIKTLGLTQKRYYTHLRNLTEAGLIQKSEEAYQHSTLGKICYKLGGAFKNALSQRDRLDLVDRLGKAKNISLEETEEIMRAILKQANISPGVIIPVKMYDTFEQVVKEINDHLENAENTGYFATKYFDSRTIEACMRASQRGVQFKVLLDKSLSIGMREKMKFLSTLFSDLRMLKHIFDFDRMFNESARYVDLPYTFIVIDAKHGMIEITNPLTNKFYVAFFFQDEKVCERLLENFRMLWERGSVPEPKVSRQ